MWYGIDILVTFKIEHTSKTQTLICRCFYELSGTFNIVAREFCTGHGSHVLSCFEQIFKTGTTRHDDISPLMPIHQDPLLVETNITRFLCNFSIASCLVHEYVTRVRVIELDVWRLEIDISSWRCFVLHVTWNRYFSDIQDWTYIGNTNASRLSVDASTSCLGHSILWPGSCAIQRVRPKHNSNIAKHRSSKTYFSIVQSFWNFVQATAVILSCFEQIFKTFIYLENKWWANEISQDLGLRSISEISYITQSVRCCYWC